VVTLPGKALPGANRGTYANRGLFQGAILGFMRLKCLSVELQKKARSLDAERAIGDGPH